MKNLFLTGFTGILLLLFVSNSQAQKTPPINEYVPDKPLLFSSLPEKFECNAELLEKIFSIDISQKINLFLNPAFQTEGIIVEKIRKGYDLLSINIHLSNYNKAIFNISRITEKGNNRYVGRIMNIANGDLLILSKEGDRYFFIKQQQKYTMVE